MKKILLSLLIFTFAISFSFAERHWNDRIFEFNVNIPVNISNNTFVLDDIMQETVVIDFTKIADNMTSDGFNTIINTSPSAGFKLDVPSGLLFGVTTGVDVYSNLTIDKSLFNFLGHGNELNEDLDIDLDGYIDAFMYIRANLGWDFDRFKISFSPSVYAALLHASTNGSYVKVTNSDEGKFAYKLQGNMNIYSLVGVDDSFTDTFKSMDFAQIGNRLLGEVNNIWQSAGVDLQVDFSYELYRYFTLMGTLKMPVIPARMSYVIPMSVSSEFETSILDVVNGETGAPSFEKDIGSCQRADYKINRPMKISLMGNFHPWNGVMEYYGGIGLGFDHPFASDPADRGAYFDYLIGTRFGILNLLNFYLSTERTDRIYIHKAIVALNLRLIELDVGVASESTSLINSFKAGGVGAFVNVSVGM